MIFHCERNVCHTCERIMAKLFIFPIKIFIFFLAFSAWTYMISLLIFQYAFWLSLLYVVSVWCNMIYPKMKKKTECMRRNECLCTMYLKHFCTCEDFTSLSKIFFQMFMTIMLIRKSSQNFLVQFFLKKLIYSHLVLSTVRIVECLITRETIINP